MYTEQGTSPSRIRTTWNKRTTLIKEPHILKKLKYGKLFYLCSALIHYLFIGVALLSVFSNICVFLFYLHSSFTGIVLLSVRLS